MMLLAGDIGGTKTDLAVYSDRGGPHAPLLQAEVHSADYPSLQALVGEFLKTLKTPVDRACFDVAGPVIDGHVRVTNLPWAVDEASLTKDLKLKSVRLINDLEAVARAIPILRPIDVRTLNAGQPVKNGAIGVVAPGTGLGESFLTWDGSKYVSHSSEGGHADFSPTDDRQIGLLRYMLRQYNHCSFEHVCSGIGIPNIYDYLKTVEQIPEDIEVAELISSATDRTAVIVESAIKPQNPSKLCAATVDMFVSILASESSNLALKVLATGGVYLAGGIPLHMLKVLEGPDFMRSFKRKGRFAELMEHTPVHIILTRAALLGSAAYGLESMKEEA
jgi:glucokinase